LSNVATGATKERSICIEVGEAGPLGKVVAGVLVDDSIVKSSTASSADVGALKERLAMRLV
jgi:hypothetical protein